jgi:hypothetical protein
MEFEKNRQDGAWRPRVEDFYGRPQPRRDTVDAGDAGVLAGALNLGEGEGVW